MSTFVAVEHLSAFSKYVVNNKQEYLNVYKEVYKKQLIVYEYAKHFLDVVSKEDALNSYLTYMKCLAEGAYLGLPSIHTNFEFNADRQELLGNIYNYYCFYNISSNRICLHPIYKVEEEANAQTLLKMYHNFKKSLQNNSELQNCYMDEIN